MAKKRALKIGFLFDDTLDSQDGVAQYVKSLGGWLSQQGHQVRYLVGETKLKEWAGGKVYSMSKNQRVSFNGNQANIPFPASRKKIKSVLRVEKFDVLHVQVPYSPFMAQMVINAADKKTTIIGTFHVAPGSIWSSWGGHILRLMYGRSLKRFDEIFSVSPAAALYASSAFKLKTDILPNVVDVKRFADATKYKSQKNKKIVFLGRLVKRKGCAELLRAFGLLAQEDQDVQLIIGGDGPERKQLEKLAKGFGPDINNRVKFLGFISEEDKPSLLASADIACFPSLYGESFGIVLIEAMAAGSRIVLGGDNTGYRSVLGAQEKLLVNSRLTDEFSSRLKELLQKNTETTDLHQWQLETVKQYDVNLVGRELCKAYEAAIAKRSVNRHN